MVEAISNSIEDYLIDGLSFKLRKGASYVTKRKLATFHPQGSNIYKAEQGTKLIKINLNSSDWLDPSTVRVQMKLTNEDGTNTLTPISGAWGFIKRLRILSGGTLVEDITNYNRLQQMHENFKNPNDYANDLVEASFGPLAGNKSSVANLKLVSGLLNQPKYIPLRVCPITIEMELVSSNGDALNTNGTHSNTWNISDVSVKCDLITLDNELDNEYTKTLLDGKSLPISFSTYINQEQVVSGSKVSVNVNRSVSRLNSIFISFENASGTILKTVNNFHHPMGATYDYDNEITASVQLGSEVFPDYPISNLSESFVQLKKAVLGSDNSKAINIDATGYRTNKFIMGVSLEKITEASHTGMNTRTGSLLTIMASCNSDLSSTMHLTMVSSQILQIQDTGNTVFD